MYFPDTRSPPVGHDGPRAASGRRIAVSDASTARARRLRRHVRSVRNVAIRRALRLRVVPDGRSGLAAVLLRLLGPGAALRLHLDWRRPVGVAHASLRTLGLCAQPLVLDSRTYVGTCVGLLGVCPGLRELVPSWLRRPTRLRVLVWLRPVVGRMVDSAAGEFRRVSLLRASERRRPAKDSRERR